MSYDSDDLDNDFTNKVAVAMVMRLGEYGVVEHLKRMSKLWKQYNDKRYTLKQRNDIKEILAQYMFDVAGLAEVLQRVVEWSNNSITNVYCLSTKGMQTYTEAPGA